MKTPAAQSDAALVLAAQSRSGDAEEALYRRHSRYLAGMVIRMLGSRVDAEDVVQDTFLVALERIGTLRDGGAVRPWLAQIAVRLVHRRLRRRKLMRVLGLDRTLEDAPLEAFASDLLAGEARVRLAELDAALARLPPAQRIAWMLRRVEGCKLEEVAATCRCSLATAKRRIAAGDAAVGTLVDVSGDAE